MVTTSLFYFSVPTPGTANIFDGYTSYIGDTVIFSQKGGYFPGGLELRFSSIYNSDSIFYTLDGSEPNTAACATPLPLLSHRIELSEQYHLIPKSFPVTLPQIPILLKIIVCLLFASVQIQTIYGTIIPEYMYWDQMHHLTAKLWC